MDRKQSCIGASLNVSSLGVGAPRCETWPQPRSGGSPGIESHRVPVTGSTAAPCYHWKTVCVCVFDRSSLGTECVGHETKASNETRRMAHAAHGCPTRSVPACLRHRDWHADRDVHPRPFGHYRRSRDPSPAPMSGGRTIDHQFCSHQSNIMLVSIWATRRLKTRSRR